MKAPAVSLDPSSPHFESELQQALDEISSVTFTAGTMTFEPQAFSRCEMPSVFTLEYSFPRPHGEEFVSDSTYSAKGSQLIPGVLAV